MFNSSLKWALKPSADSCVRYLSALACGVLLFSAQNALSETSANKSSEVPAALKDAVLVDKPGAEVSADIKFKDENGKDVTLGQYFQSGRPVILTLGYYECPMLCSLVLNGVLDGLRGLPADWSPGTKFEIVSVSIDPKEKPADALAKKNSYIEALGRAGAEASWHFLTGEESQARKLADQVGFGYKWDPNEKQYAHGAGIFILTPDRKVSRTLFGIQYRPKDVKLALLEASNGKIGTVVDRLLMFCYQYNVHTRKYSLVATRLVQAGSAGTVLLFGGYLAVFWRRQIRRSKGSPDESEKS